MKNILSILLFMILIIWVVNNRLVSGDLIQMVVTIPQLNSSTLIKDIEEDIYKISGIQFIETSLLSKSMLINYDPKRISSNDILHVLFKWGYNSPSSCQYLHLNNQ